MDLALEFLSSLALSQLRIRKRPKGNKETKEKDPSTKASKRKEERAEDKAPAKKKKKETADK